MADFAPPSGPPPPKVPEGWKALWNDQYHEWFYVNLHTKQSQWDRPTEPVYPSSGGPPSGPPPPNYDHNTSQQTYPEKSAGGYLNSNNPYSGGATSSHPSNQDISADEALARKLQEEENARLRGAGNHSAGSGDRGASDGYYGGGASNTAPQYGQSYGQQSQQQYGGQPELPARDAGKSKGGFLGKLLGKASGGGSSSSMRPQQGYGGYPQQHGYPQQGYGGYPQQGGYGGYPQQGYGGGYQQGYPPKKKAGMGAGGAAALGVGGGLLGGMLLADAMEDHDEHEYDQGYNDGQDNGGGDDYGGGDDMGGGDF